MGILEDLMKVLIVFIVVGLPITFIFGQPMIKRLLEHREKRMEIEARLTAEKAAQYASQTERLEQRVRVLERIVTDKGLTSPTRSSAYAKTGRSASSRR